MTQPGFDARALTTRLAFLDELPDSIYAAVVTHPAGELGVRARSVLRFRQALLAGRIVPAVELPWLPAESAEAVVRQLTELEIARFCREEPSLADAVVLSVLEQTAGHLDGLEELRRGKLNELVREEEGRRRLAAEARRQDEEEHRKVTEGVQQSRRKFRGDAGRPRKREDETAAMPAIDEQTKARLAVEAERWATEAAVKLLAGRLREEWAERAEMWAQIADVFGDLGALLHVGWDLSKGMLRSHGWLKVMELRKLVAQLPALQALIRTLGRMQVSDRSDRPPVLEEIIGSLRRATTESREVPSPLAPTETRGVERSGELARMLPSEAVLLGHPVLKALWHARRAERALLTYRVEGVLTERVPGENEEMTAQVVARPAPERGPIVICLDTSGSMAGLPELVAKALTLEALRVAHAERRRCYLIAFSGPGEVAEQELALTQEGLARLMALLAMSFHGGTDASGPVLRAARLLEENAWRRADLLLVSDGDFATPAKAQSALARMTEEHGLRVHGVLVSGDDSPAMRALCDPLHGFLDWEALRDGGGGR